MSDSVTHRVERRLKRPPRQVWAFYWDVQNYPRWVPNVVEASQIAGSVNGAGERVYRFRYAGGDTTELPVNVIEYAAPQKAVTRWTSSAVACEDVTEFHPDGEGTRLVFTATGREAEQGFIADLLTDAEEQWEELVTIWEGMFDNLVRVMAEAPPEPSAATPSSLAALDCTNCGAPLMIAHQGPLRCVYCGQTLNAR